MIHAMSMFRLLSNLLQFQQPYLGFIEATWLLVVYFLVGSAITPAAAIAVFAFSLQEQ